MFEPIQWKRPSLLAVILMLAAESWMTDISKKRSAAAAEPAKLRVYVGTYSGKQSKGIYAFVLDVAKGTATAPVLAAETVNPSFLAIHPSQKFLYAVGELEGSGKGGAVRAFAIEPRGGLRPINEQSSMGAGPCHLVVDPKGKNVLVANYSGGSVAALPIRPDGSLGQASSFIQHEGSSVDRRRQARPHAHSINLDAAGRYAVAADLGLDKCLVYRFDAEHGKLSPNDPPAAAVAPGAGPRHFAFHPNGKFAYVINEMASTVTAFAYDGSSGVLKELQTIGTLPEEFDGSNTTAEVQVHPSGRFLYGSNRGHDSIAAFRIDPRSGKLTPIGHEPTGGKTPRNFGIDPTGSLLLAANQASDTIRILRIDRKTGRLNPTDVVVAVPSPVCVKMLPISAAGRAEN